MFEKLSNFARRNWFALSLACAVGAIPAIGQVFTAPPNFTLGGHYVASGNPPTGTGCTIAAGSSDTDGSCTASATSGSIAFATAYLVAPTCLVTDGSATSTVSMPVYTTTTSQITLTTIISTHVLYWHCAGKIGG